MLQTTLTSILHGLLVLQQEQYLEKRFLLFPRLISRNLQIAFLVKNSTFGVTQTSLSMCMSAIFPGQSKYRLPFHSTTPSWISCSSLSPSSVVFCPYCWWLLSFGRSNKPVGLLDGESNLCGSDSRWPAVPLLLSM